MQAMLPVSADVLQPHWYRLESRRNSKKKKGGDVSGEVQLQFTLADTSDPSAEPQDLLQKLSTLTAMTPDEDSDEEEDLSRLDSLDIDDDEEDEADDKEPATSDETDDAAKPEKAEKRKRRLRMKRLKRKTKARAYEFAGRADVVGIVFLEIGKINDLPPERNSRNSMGMFAYCMLNG